MLISQDNQLLCGLRQQYQLCDVCYWLTYVTNVVHWWFMDHFTSMHIHSSNGFDNSWLLGCSPPLHLWVLSPSSTGTFLLELSSRSRSGLGLWSANQRMCCFIWLTVHWDTWHGWLCIETLGNVHWFLVCQSGGANWVANKHCMLCRLFAPTTPLSFHLEIGWSVSLMSPSPTYSPSRHHS